MLTSAKLRRSRQKKLYFLKLPIDVYLRAKFVSNLCEVSCIILTDFRQGVILPPPTSKRTPKKSTQIKDKNTRLVIEQRSQNGPKPKTPNWD